MNSRRLALPAVPLLTAPAAEVLEGTVVPNGIRVGPICGAYAAVCTCTQPPGHYHYPDSPHACHPVCGGSWWGIWGGRHFEVVTYPRLTAEVLLGNIFSYALGFTPGGYGWGEAR